MSRGVVFALTAYLLWGVFPLYFKQVQSVAPLEVLANRMVWSLVFVAGLLTILRGTQWLRDLLRNRPPIGWFALSALAVSLNWLIYIWAVNTGHIVDASLGYFINPLLNVLIGALFLHERLRPAHWVAVLLAALAVAWLTWSAGQLPWIGLTLAISFAAYGLLRKRAPLGAIEGLAVETALLAPAAIAYLAWLAFHRESALLEALSDGRPALVVSLLLAGPITAVPLLFFAAGVRRIPFATLGILQYVGPSLQLLIGVRLYGEPFEADKLIAYGAIWLALAIFSIDGLMQWRSSRSTPP
ncbi:MAG TPA: EamA family transporter RarD [Burkholderiaceae bacterium]|nr:EamA family transporter RarD [Burkholderiaceae bacterium]